GSLLGATGGRQCWCRFRSDHRENAQKAGCGDARLHSVVTLASKHFPDGRSCTDTNIAFLKLRRGGRLAGLVSGIGVRTNSRIAQGQVVDYSTYNDRDTNVGNSPIESGLVLLEVANCSCDRRQPHGSTTGQQKSMDRVNWTHGLKEDSQMRAGRGAVVIDARGSFAFEKQRGATCGPP